MEASHAATLFGLQGGSDTSGDGGPDPVSISAISQAAPYSISQPRVVAAQDFGIISATVDATGELVPTPGTATGIFGYTVNSSASQSFLDSRFSLDPVEAGFAALFSYTIAGSSSEDSSAPNSLSASTGMSLRLRDGTSINGAFADVAERARTVGNMGFQPPGPTVRNSGSLVDSIPIGFGRNFELRFDVVAGTSNQGLVQPFGGTGLATAHAEWELTYTITLAEDRRHWDADAGGAITNAGSQWVEQDAPDASAYAVFNDTNARTLAVSLSGDRTWRGVIVDGEIVALNLGGQTLDLTTTGNSTKEYNILVGEGRNGTSKLTLSNGTVAASKSIFVGMDARPNPATPVTAELVVDGAQVTSAAGLVVGGVANAQGKLMIQNGGRVTAQTLRVAAPEGSRGDILVEGVGSQFAILGASGSVGAQGRGEIEIRGGASANWGATIVNVGSTTNHFSVIRIAGAGTSSTGGSFNIGNGALFEVRDGASFQTTGGFEILTGGTVHFDGITASTFELSVPGGTLSLTNGAALTVNHLTLNTGTIQVTGNSSLTISNEFELTKGNIQVATGSTFFTTTLQLNPETVLGGTGTFHAGEVRNADGTVSPGFSPGILTIDGDYEQTNIGLLNLEIGGLALGTEYDQLVVTGDVSLGGIVRLAFINGFAPSAGQTFSLLDVGGTFANTATFSVDGLEPGWQFDTGFDVGTGDFTLTSLNNGIAAVPEPASWALLLVGGFLLLAATRKQPIKTR